MDTLLRDHSNRIASLLAKSMRAKAGLRLRKLQNGCGVPGHADHYNGVAMYEKLKGELASSTDAYDAEMHERAVEQMRDDTLHDNCSGQDYADKVQRLLRDHNPYLPV
eukprot:889895-Pleurochrysis_carterae.AAC.1